MGRNVKEFMRKILKEEKYFTIALLLLIIGMLIPLLVISGYNIMSADDYAMGKGIHGVSENPSFMMVLRYAVDFTGAFYKGWQGCFSINFLDCFNPAFFHENNAWMTPVMMLLVLMASKYFWVHTCMKTFFDAGRREIFSIWAVYMFLAVQTMPAMNEAIFWYSGAVAYTVPEAMFFVFFALLIRMEKENKKHSFGNILFMTIFAFLLGGGQYTLVLEAMIWYTLYWIYAGLRYHKISLGRVLIGISLIAGSIISIMAPGNRVRQTSGSGGMGAIKAVIYSFVYMLQHLRIWITPMFLLCVLLSVPIIWRILGKSKIKWRFAYPLPVVLFSFCILASCFTAPLYGLSDVSSGRLQNQLQGFFYLIIYLDLFYILGRLRFQATIKDGFSKDLTAAVGILKKYRQGYLWVMLAMVLLVWVGTGDKNTFNSISALRSVVIGEAGQFYAENENRLQQYKDFSLSVVEVEPYSVQPHLLFLSDLDEEDGGNYWVNESIATYYGKDKVLLNSAYKANGEQYEQRSK